MAQVPDLGTDIFFQLASGEIILPEQYWEGPPSDLRGEPERRLMRAVLLDALLVCARHWQRRSERSRRLVAEVEEWVRNESRSSPFAFASICDVLGIDAAHLREAIRRWRQHVAATPRFRRQHSGRGRHQVGEGLHRLGGGEPQVR
jgi:hypothetical protein